MNPDLLKSAKMILCHILLVDEGWVYKYNFRIIRDTIIFRNPSYFYIFMAYVFQCSTFYEY